jgi:hypothetical protein
MERGNEKKTSGELVGCNTGFYMFVVSALSLFKAAKAATTNKLIKTPNQGE